MTDEELSQLDRILQNLSHSADHLSNHWVEDCRTLTGIVAKLRSDLTEADQKLGAAMMQIADDRLAIQCLKVGDGAIDRLREENAKLREAAQSLVDFWNTLTEEQTKLTAVEADELTELECALREALKDSK